MRTSVVVLFGFAWLVIIPLSRAAEPAYEPAAVARPGTNPVAATPDTPGPARSASDSDAARNAQVELLTQLAQEHRQRAHDTAAAGQTDRTIWENDLANELHARAEQLQGRHNEPAKEPSSNAIPPALAGESAGNGLNGDEQAYLDKIHERLDAVQQEIAAVTDQAAAYALQLPTNTVPYDYSVATRQIQENGRELRQLHTEQAGLELKRLEFWALRRRGR
jgi:hypothetical protein